MLGNEGSRVVFLLNEGGFFYVDIFSCVNSFPDIISGFHEILERESGKGDHGDSLRAPESECGDDDDNKERNGEEQLAVKKGIGGDKDCYSPTYPQKLTPSEPESDFVFNFDKLGYSGVHKCKFPISKSQFPTKSQCPNLKFRFLGFGALLDIGAWIWNF
jgi:hypothetical protein